MILDATDQKELAMHLEELFDAMGIGIIATVCCECGLLLGFKDGLGCHGISDGYCEPCKDRAIKGLAA